MVDEDYCYHTNTNGTFEMPNVSESIVDWLVVFKLRYHHGGFNRLMDVNDLDRFRQPLLHILVTDMFYGHPITQMSAISLLNYIILSDPSTNSIIQYLEQQGLIKVCKT